MEKISNKEWVAVHNWLKKEHGKATMCENEDCPSFTVGESVIYYHWCLKAGCQYEKKRENFMQMCIGCHVRYDRANGLYGLYEKREVKNPKYKATAKYLYFSGTEWSLIGSFLKIEGRHFDKFAKEAITEKIKKELTEKYKEN